MQPGGAWATILGPEGLFLVPDEIVRGEVLEADLLEGRSERRRCLGSWRRLRVHCMSAG